MSDAPKTETPGADDDVGRLPEDVWDALPDDAKALIVSLRDDRGDAAKYRGQLRDAEAARDAAVAERDALAAEVEDLKANAPDVDAAVKAAVDSALEEHRPELLKAKVKAAAATVLAHPEDAVALIDWTDVSLEDDEAISSKIDEFVESRPDLKAERTPTAPPRGPQGGTGASKSWARELAKASG